MPSNYIEYYKQWRYIYDACWYPFLFYKANVHITFDETCAKVAAPLNQQYDSI